MEKLGNIRLISGKVELAYTGTDEAGNVVEKVEAFQVTPQWAALLLRYLSDHHEHGRHAMGSRAIPLQGSAEGDFPGVDESRWSPHGPFIG